MGAHLKPRQYINIHPSYLPDLRGGDPVIGSILFNKDSGASCHHISDYIDEGDIISQVKIPYSFDLNVSLLYQLCFLAEKKSFSLAFENKFQNKSVQLKSQNLLYFTRKDSDRIISFDEENNLIINKIKAFNNRSQGCQFLYRGEVIKFYSGEILINNFLLDYSESYQELQIILSYEDSIIFKKDNQVLKFSNIESNGNFFELGSFLK